MSCYNLVFKFIHIRQSLRSVSVHDHLSFTVYLVHYTITEIIEVIEFYTDIFCQYLHSCFMHSCKALHLAGWCTWSMWNKICSCGGKRDKPCYIKEEGHLYLYLQIQAPLYTSDNSLFFQTGKRVCENWC